MCIATVEGEGDGSLASWRAGHRQYFERVCQRLGGDFDGRTQVICQVFRVIWADARDPGTSRARSP